MTSAESLFACAVEQHRAGKLEEAKKKYERVLVDLPGHPGALSNLGRIARARGDLDAALKYYKRACDQPGAPAESYFNLANALRDSGDISAAIENYERALAVNPDLKPARHAISKLSNHAESVAARTLRAQHLLSEGDGDEAAAILQQIVRERPADPTALQNLGYLYRSTGHYLRALDCYRKAQGLSDDLMIRVEIANCLVNIGDISGGRREFEKLIATPQGRRAAASSYLMALLYDSSLTANFIRAEHERLTSDWPCAPKRRGHASPSRRIRVGYLTADFFGQHPVSQFLSPVLEAHASDAFGIDSFAYDAKPRTDETAKRMNALASAKLIEGMSDEAAANVIRADGIDLLIDLSGHTSGRRLSLLGLRPAPVQACFIGYPSTTGFRGVDWLIGDGVLFPPGAETFYTEKLARLPDAFLAFAPPPTMPAPLPRRRSGPVTFGSLNHLPKLNEGVVRVWARILGGVADARLLLQCAAFAEAESVERISKMFAGHGIERERLVMSAPQPFADAMKRYYEIDIALDPFPYNGGTTTAHALWMGVPVVTKAGDYFCRRMGASLLTAAGLTQFIADGDDDYVRIAIKLASDIREGNNLRGALLKSNASSPLFDTQKYASDLAILYRKMLN